MLLKLSASSAGFLFSSAQVSHTVVGCEIYISICRTFVLQASAGCNYENGKEMSGIGLDQTLSLDKLLSC